MNTEVLFNVEEADEGGYVAIAPLHGIVTQAESIAELHAQVRDAVTCLRCGGQPQLTRLHFVRHEVPAA